MFESLFYDERERILTYPCESGRCFANTFVDVLRKKSSRFADSDSNSDSDSDSDSGSDPDSDSDSDLNRSDKLG